MIGRIDWLTDRQTDTSFTEKRDMCILQFSAFLRPHKLDTFVKTEITKRLEIEAKYYDQHNLLTESKDKRKFTDNVPYVIEGHFSAVSREPPLYVIIELYSYWCYSYIRHENCWMADFVALARAIITPHDTKDFVDWVPDHN